MGFASAQISIESRFNSNFAGCPVQYENVPYTPIPGTTFCTLEIVESYSQRADIGTTNPFHRSFGSIIVNFHLPLDVGTNQGRVLADTAAAIFRDQDFSGITCRSPVVRNIGEVEGWYIVNMTCPFFYNEVYA
jgi:hypothetical protein